MLISIIVPLHNQAAYIVECLESVAAQTYTNWECIIVNDGSTDNSEDVVNQWITHTAPSSNYANITYHGIESNKAILQSIYAAAHCLLLTSYREGFPMVILEAMQVGCVPICTTVGGVSEVIVHKQNGYLVNISSDINTVLKNFAKTIEQMLLKPECYLRLSNAAKSTVHNFSQSKMMQDYKTLWKDE